MTTNEIFKNKYFIFVMCIFIVIAAWSTVVFRAADNTDGTHFFAVHFMEYIKPCKPHSFSEKRPLQFVAWIHHTKYTAENTFEYLINSTPVSMKALTTFVSVLGQVIENDFFKNGKTTFYLRI